MRILPFHQQPKQDLDRKIEEIDNNIPEDNLMNQNLKTYAKNLLSFKEKFTEFIEENKKYFTIEQLQKLQEVQRQMRQKNENLTQANVFEELKTNYKTAASKTNLLNTDVISNYENYLEGDLLESLDKNILNLYKSANALGLKEIITTTQLDILKTQNLKKLKEIINLFKEDPLSTLPGYIQRMPELVQKYPESHGILEKIIESKDYVLNPFEIDISKLEQNIKDYLKVDTEFEKGDINLSDINFNLDEIPEEYAKFSTMLQVELESLIAVEEKLAKSLRLLSKARHKSAIQNAKKKIKEILQSEDVNFESLKTEFKSLKKFKEERRTSDDVAKDIVNYLEKNNLTLTDVEKELEKNVDNIVKQKIEEILESRENMYSLIAKGLENITTRELNLVVGHAAMQDKNVIEEEVQEYIHFLMRDTRTTNLRTYKDFVKGSMDIANVTNIAYLLKDVRENLEVELGINMKNVFRYLPKILKERIQKINPDLANELLDVAKEV
jgi:hypothetical protein